MRVEPGDGVGPGVLDPLVGGVVVDGVRDEQQRPVGMVEHREVGRQHHRDLGDARARRAFSSGTRSQRRTAS